MTARGDLYVGTAWMAIFVVFGGAAWLGAGMFLIGLGLGRIGQRQIDAE